MEKNILNTFKDTEKGWHLSFNPAKMPYLQALKNLLSYKLFQKRCAKLLKNQISLPLTD
jgi:hypothetical protein